MEYVLLIPAPPETAVHSQNPGHAPEPGPYLLTCEEVKLLPHNISKKNMPVFAAKSAFDALSYDSFNVFAMMLHHNAYFLRGMGSFFIKYADDKYVFCTSSTTSRW